jgi:Sulfotransferase domain
LINWDQLRAGDILHKTALTNRLFNAVRFSIGRIADVHPVRKATGLAQQNRLIAQALLELEAVMKQGHTPRLEYLLSLLHLSYVFLDETSSQALHKDLRPLLKQIYRLGRNEVDAPTQSIAPIAFFVSYPRSGNTLATRLTAMATQGQIFSAMGDGFSPFSKSIYPRAYPLPRLIKDHTAHRHYLNDKCVLVVRDGRDTVTSLAFMTLQQQRHKFTDKSDVANFIRWTAESYAFGSWAGHIRDMTALLDGRDKKLVRYEDLTANANTFCEIVDFFDPGNMLPRDHLVKLFEERDAVVERIKSNPKVNDQWGFGRTFEAGSMFYEWSLNRQRSNWRQTWDRTAKRAFHETGATEALLELGYESDPNWWRD